MCLGTNIKNLNNEHLENFKIIFPPNFLLNKYENTVEKYFELISKNNQENNLPESLRDFFIAALDE